jgi:hypothetical protein
VDEKKIADLHEAFFPPLYFVRVGVTVQSAVSLLQRFPCALQLKEQFLKEQIADGSRLFKDAVPSVSSWLRSLPVRG